MFNKLWVLFSFTPAPYFQPPRLQQHLKRDLATSKLRSSFFTSFQLAGLEVLHKLGAGFPPVVPTRIRSVPLRAAQRSPPSPPTPVSSPECLLRLCARSGFRSAPAQLAHDAFLNNSPAHPALKPRIFSVKRLIIISWERRKRFSPQRIAIQRGSLLSLELSGIP